MYIYVGRGDGIRCVHREGRRLYVVLCIMTNITNSMLTTYDYCNY